MKDLSSMPRMLLTAHASVENPDCSCLIVSKEKKKKNKRKEKYYHVFCKQRIKHRIPIYRCSLAIYIYSTIEHASIR